MEAQACDDLEKAPMADLQKPADDEAAKKHARDEATRAEKEKNEKAYLDSLKKRVQIFTETIVKMVCPVFLAVSVSLTKLHMESMGDRHKVRDSISPLVFFTLEFSMLSFFVSSAKSIADRKFQFSMPFIHVCGVLLMVLAFLILLFINPIYMPLLGFLIPIGVVTLISALWSFWNGHEQIAKMYYKYGDELENSVDFSAAITFLLFLGLGGFVLGGQYSTIEGEEPEYKKLLALSLGLSFVICILGVLFMLVSMTPPSPVITYNGQMNLIEKGKNDLCSIVDRLNIILAVTFAAIVLLISLGALRNWHAASVLFVLSCFPCMAWIVNKFDRSAGQRPEGEEVKPASLDLTKVTFTGFLAISVHTLSNSSISIGWDAFSFIFFTAAAVNAGLGWRLFTHEKKSSQASFKAAYVASLCARLWIAIAVIPFAFMAFNALREITTASPAPSPNCW